MPTPFDWLNPELRKLSDESLLRYRVSSQPLPQGKIQRDGKELWNFAGNDYLGLASDQRLVSAAIQAAEEYGIGARASALVSGRMPIHVELEQKLCELKKSEAALLFPTGYAANVGTICALVGAGDVVFCDRLNHASLVDGSRLSKAKFRVYPHCDMNVLEAELKKASVFRRKLIVTDSLFSMDGDVAPVVELTQLAERYNAMLLVDEAHATGVFGPTGAGLVEEAGVTSVNLVSIGTFSKALGAQGGFVTGSNELIEWIWNTARTQMFSTALAPPLCAAVISALEIIQQEPERREWLSEQSQHVQNELRAQGWPVPENVSGPIIPVITRDTTKTMQLARELQAHGVLVAAIRPPTVPNGTSRLRISLSYAHQGSGVNSLVKAFSSLRVFSGCM